MKKQLLAAAVAATMASVASADISITGNAKFEYFNTQTGTDRAVNETNTEVNLGIKGQNGGTSVVANLELSNQGQGDGGAADVDFEDLYMTTKIGDFTIKAGNYASSTSALLGEIDEGGRATSKVTISTNVGGATLYAGNADDAATTVNSSNGKSDIDNNMFAGIKMDLQGVTVQAKKNSPTVNSFGIAGSVADVNYRLEHKSSDTANNDVTFGNITTTASGMTVGYAWVDAQAVDLINESDSAIFAVEAAGAATVDGLRQVMASTSVEGNKVTLKAGTVEEGTTDNDYTQIGVSRGLASGSTLAVTYTDKENVAATTSTETFEVDLSVKF